ncbi:MAG TPA: cupredoxin domain-containing protein [Acidimicrobiales bacterium]|nr:cupredoxin domain-containing protein [Acidimicrobiales bacterium]
MFNAASKTSFTAATAALALGFGAVLATSDRVAFSVMLFASAVTTALGIAVFYFTPRDPVVPASAEVEAAAVRTTDVSDLPRSSLWPLLGAVAGFGWLGQAWTEHPSWTRAMTDRINERFVVPIGLPGTIIALAGLSAVSLSRIFLAVSADAAPVVGVVVAFALLGSFYLLSTRETIGRGTITALVGVAAVFVIGAGVAGAIAGEREFHEAGGEHAGEGGSAEAFVLAVTDDGFEPSTLQLPAASEVVIEIENEGSSARSFAIYTEEGGEVLLPAEDVPAGETVAIEWSTPEPGTYHFQDDANPDDDGSLVVAEGASAGTEVEEGTNPATTSTTEH